MNLNSYNKKSLLVISDCPNLLKSSAITNAKLSFFDTNKFYLLNNIINNFDLIIFDNRFNDLDKFIKTFGITKSYNFNIPIISIENNSINDIKLHQKANVYSVINYQIEEINLIKNIELCLNFLDTNKKIETREGYFFDISREILSFEKKIIRLTKTETKLIKLFCENKDNLTSYEEIKDKIWLNRKFSMYTLRNVIMNIREKTSESFIKNHTNKGYTLDII